ncbi:hypothetical protein AB7M26_005149 [Pseudomonas sp. F-14 TE3482]
MVLANDVCNGALLGAPARGVGGFVVGCCESLSNSRRARLR